MHNINQCINLSKRHPVREGFHLYGDFPFVIEFRTSLVAVEVPFIPVTDSPNQNRNLLSRFRFYRQITSRLTPLKQKLIMDCTSPSDIASAFYVSGEASVYIFSYFQKWKYYGETEYEPFEMELLQLFSVA